jgi:hypothetical protein
MGCRGENAQISDGARGPGDRQTGGLPHDLPVAVRLNQNLNSTPRLTRLS